MNEKQPYEHYLREKLQQIEAPGQREASWQKMKALLNQYLPEGGESPRRRAAYWWWLGAFLLLLAGLTGYKLLNPVSTDPNWEANAVAEPINQPQTSPLSNASPPLQAAGKRRAAGEGSSDHSTASSFGKPPAVNERSTGTAVENNSNSNPVVSIQSNSTNIDQKTTRQQKNKVYGQPVTNSSANNRSLSESSSLYGRSKVTKAENRRAGRVTVKQTLSTYANTKIDPAAETLYPFPASSEVKGIAASHAEIVSISPGNLQETYPSPLPITPVNKALLKRWQRYGMAYSGKSRKKQPMAAGTGEAKHLVWGLSLPLSFPLADQKPVGYNFNGGYNTVSDYIPSPHFQYHMNDHSYFQAELQFIAPQYIQPMLLYQSGRQWQGGGYQYVTHSVYARKLYYFNIPLAVHYSPYRNFFLGTGLQYSSLISGIAQTEDRGYSSWPNAGGGTILDQQFSSFKRDSLSQRLSPGEFRLLLDANYYWHRFTVGLRYNQALSNYVSIRVIPGGDYFADKNKSLQFYLRYNLWEDLKAKKK